MNGEAAPLGPLPGSLLWSRLCSAWPHGRAGPPCRLASSRLPTRLSQDCLLQIQPPGLVAQLVKNCLQCTRPWFSSWVGKIPWRRDRLSTPVFLGFPSGSDSEGSACSMGDPGSIPGSGRSPEGGCGNLLQYSCLGNPHGQRSLVGYSPWGRKETDRIE